jgi:hypothetical protein
VARFFGLAAPEFLTMSATLQLPVPGLDVQPEDETRLRRQLRDLDYNSDRHLPRELSSDQAALVEEKRRLVAQQHAVCRNRPGARCASSTRGSGAGYTRFRRLQEINRQLTTSTQVARQRIEEELLRTRQHLAANAVWHDREYASCLYPAEKLQRFMDHVCSATLK